MKQGGSELAMEAALAEASALVLEKCGCGVLPAPVMDSLHEEQAAPGDEEADDNNSSDAEQSATA